MGGIHVPKIQVVSAPCYTHSYNNIWLTANFTMASTNLTLEGFIQPTVARSIIELPGNAEKGLSQWFIWTFPKPTYADFETLEPADTFSSAIGNSKSIICVIQFKAYQEG